MRAALTIISCVLALVALVLCILALMHKVNITVSIVVFLIALAIAEIGRHM
jgi:hypothetical protein